MDARATLTHSLHWTWATIRFIKQNWPFIISMAFVAAFGRVVQLGAWGPLSPLTHWLLEVIIEGSRLLLFVYTLSLANLPSGLNKFRHLFTGRADWQRTRLGAVWRLVLRRLLRGWPALLLNFIAFAMIALVLNAFIDHIAYRTCLYVTLKARQFIAERSSEWVLILFFKNLSVIPFTLIFDALFFLWLTNSLPKSKAVAD